MRALLDINVLIALLDPDHTFHERAHVWWDTNRNSGWSSCPLTENGVVRIMANPNYSQKLRLTPEDLIRRITEFASQTNHEFWSDDVSLRDALVFDRTRFHSARLLTDIYLLALSVAHGGQFVTLDEGIPLSAVRSATAQHLVVL
jgi:uncharacterized protein